MWSIAPALSYLRSIEEACVQRGYNIALGGSVMMRGESSKDLYVICVPIPRDWATEPQVGVLFRDWLWTMPGHEPIEGGVWNSMATKIKVRDSEQRVIEFFVFSK